jgi:hypothetical protein
MVAESDSLLDNQCQSISIIFVGNVINKIPVQALQHRVKKQKRDFIAEARYSLSLSIKLYVEGQLWSRDGRHLHIDLDNIIRTSRLGYRLA